MQKRVYVKNYGQWWSLKYTDWLRFLQNGAAGNAWNLDEYGKRLKSTPNHYGFYFKPLDWTEEEFKYQIEMENEDADRVYKALQRLRQTPALDLVALMARVFDVEEAIEMGGSAIADFQVTNHARDYARQIRKVVAAVQEQRAAGKEVYVCQLCHNPTKHEEESTCSECGGCEHCCEGLRDGGYFRACEEKESD